MTPIISLKPGKERSAKRLHPWIFSGAIKTTPPGLTEGDIVKVTASNGASLGSGFYGSSSISVKLCAFGNTELNDEFWSEQFRKAFSLRQALGLIKAENMYRLINAEGDGIPGLIIDIYGNAAVIQAHHQGISSIKEQIVNSLEQLYGAELEIIYWQNLFSKNEEGEYLKGSKPSEHIVLENNLKFAIDWEDGQKTGFFIDQRRNRNLVSELTPGKKVLNAFSYSGGFSAYALKTGALEVTSVDSSEKANILCKRNIELNFGDTKTHTTVKEDCLTYLRNIYQKFDFIILDPPAFAKHRGAVDGAMAGYRDINRLAMKALPSGGLLATFSCSQLVSRDMFQEAVFTAAIQADRKAQIIHRLGQSEDHPFSAFHPEGEYLKGLVLRIS